MKGTSEVVPTSSKDAILDAAESLMGQVGYARASISQICRRSGLPVGSVYHHFGSKAGLLSAVMERGSLRLYASMPQPNPDPSVSSEQRVRDYWIGAADAIYTNLRFFTLDTDLMRFEQDDGDIARAMTRVREITYEHLGAVLTPYLHELGVAAPETLARQLIGFSVTFTRGAVIEANGDLPRLRELMKNLYTYLHSRIASTETIAGLVEDTGLVGARLAADGAHRLPGSHSLPATGAPKRSAVIDGGGKSTRSLSSSSSRRILDSAERLFAARGYAGTSISDICRDSKQNNGTVYWHFTNKLGLFDAVLQRGFSRFLGALPEPSKVAGTPNARLRDYFETAAGVIQAQPDIFRIRLGLPLLPKDDAVEPMASAQRADEVVVEQVAGALRPVVEEYGILDPADLAHDIADLVVDMTTGILVRTNWDTRLLQSNVQRLVRVVEMFIAGAATSPRGDR